MSRDMAVLHNLSDPSTDVTDQVLGQTNLADYMDPYDGAYPFIEWSDLGTKARHAAVKARVPEDTKALFTTLNDPARTTTLVYDKAIQQDTLQGAVLYVVAQIGLAVRDEAQKRQEAAQEAAQRPPTPAKSGDLMAMPHEAQKAAQWLASGDRDRLSKATFHRPVNAWTMLRPDMSVARGGDMLGWMTVEDAKEKQGKITREVSYEARVVAL